MRIQTSLVPTRSGDSGLQDPPSGDCAVVIDVLRATSVMTAALFHGASEVVTCDTVDAAKVLRSGSDETTLLCGERQCRPIDGFDIGNSPSDYGSDTVAGRRVILTTTNGTKAIQSVAAFRDVYIASFFNLTRTATALRHRATIQLVCSGTNRQVSGEDVLLAGALVDQFCRWDPSTQYCDSSQLAKQFWRSIYPPRESVQLARSFRETLGGRNLIRAGYENDLAECAKIDQKPVLVRRVSRAPACFRIDSTQ